MTGRSGVSRAALALVVTLLAGVGLIGCGAAEPVGRVTVLGSWTGDEETTFRAVLARFEGETGIRAEYQGHRDVSQVLQAGIERQRPPDVAVLPRLNDLQRYVNEDAVRQLDGVAGLTDDPAAGRQLIRLAARTGSDDAPTRVYAVAIATHLKSVFWYDRTRAVAVGLRQPPRTWDELVDRARTVRDGGGMPWCLGLSSPPVSGWPGTDWIEDILLHRSGQRAYESWTRGELAWSSPQMRDAWRTWGQLLSATPSPEARRAGLFSTWAEAGAGLFDARGGCHLDHQASFAVREYRKPPRSAGNRVDFFPTPPIGSADTGGLQEVSDDIAAMLRDTGPARKLMAFLASESAQQVWRRASGGLFFSRRGPADSYPDQVTGRVAARLGTGTLCWDGSDLLPAPVATAFERATLVYLHQPERLDELLRELDGLAGTVSRTDGMDLRCHPAAE